MSEETTTRSWRNLTLLALIALTQSGCFTLLTATACVASSSSGCGTAIAAAAAVDAVVIDAAVRAGHTEGYYEEGDEYDAWAWDSCFDPDDCYYD